jgi:COP9 signalosome complex subunit 1
VAVATDRRVEMQVKSLTTAKDYEKEAIERIRRMSLVAADLEVKGMARRGGGGVSSTNPGDAWFDETRRQMSQQSQQGGPSSS